MNIYHATDILDKDAQGHYPAGSMVEEHRRRSTIRNIRRLAMRRIAAGDKDAEKIAQEVQTELMQSDEFNSIMLIIGLAVLSAIIQ